MKEEERGKREKIEMKVEIGGKGRMEEEGSKE